MKKLLISVKILLPFAFSSNYALNPSFPIARALKKLQDKMIEQARVLEDIEKAKAAAASGNTEELVAMLEKHGVDIEKNEALLKELMDWK